MEYKWKKWNECKSDSQSDKQDTNFTHFLYLRP